MRQHDQLERRRIRVPSLPNYIALTSGNLFNDLTNNTLPGFSLITPNVCNDTHDCSITTGDTWLSR